MGQIDEAMLLKALQARLLADIERKNEAAIQNNIYGYGGGPQGASVGGMGGIASEMSRGSPISDDTDSDYLVDILKENIIDPETGKSTGWKKQVHRHKQKKDGGSHPPKKGRSGGS